MKKILVLFAHPAFQKSRVNKMLVNGLEGIDGVTFHDLYQVYPEMEIDVAREKELLEAHDIIIFHQPFFWYSTPAILKEWQDLVLEHGWAYGSQGIALKGKLFFNVITTGGRKEGYSSTDKHYSTIRQLLSPIERTARLCKMIFLPPFVVHGTHSITDEQVDYYKNNYHKILKLLRHEKIEIADVSGLGYFNDYFE